ncbi:hypothetical protein [Caulobacter segnis]
MTTRRLQDRTSAGLPETCSTAGGGRMPATANIMTAIGSNTR